MITANGLERFELAADAGAPPAVVEADALAEVVLEPVLELVLDVVVALLLEAVVKVVLTALEVELVREALDVVDALEELVEDEADEVELAVLVEAEAVTLLSTVNWSE